jgi:hypothetical protein
MGAKARRSDQFAVNVVHRLFHNGTLQNLLEIKGASLCHDPLLPFGVHSGEQECDDIDEN